MADIAHLGFRIDSSEADKGTASLNKLTGAAERAETAERGLAAASKATSAAGAAVTTTANNAAAALTKEAAAATRASAAVKVANDNTRRMSGSFSGLGAQFQDIGVTAAMGMSPMLIGLQQGSQLAGQMEVAMQGGQSAVGALSTAFRSLLSPLTLITIGLTVLAAAGLQMVDWSSAASGALNLLATAIDAIGPYAIAAAGTLALLYAPAIISGIGAVIKLMGLLSLSAIRAAASFTVAWLAALGPAGWFILGLAAVAAAVYIFRDQIKDVFGVDVVAAVKDGTNAVIAVMVGGYNGLVAAWDNLPEALGDIAYKAANKFLEGLYSMIREAQATINGWIAGLNGKLRGTGIQIPDLGNPIIGLKGGYLDNPYAGAAGKVGDTISKAIKDAQGTDYVGMIGKGISDMTSGAAEKLRSLAGSIGGVEEAAKKAGKAGKAAGDKIKDGAKAAADAWEKTKSALQQAGQSAGGILKGLISGTLSWKDALSQALSVALKLMTSINPNLFGGGFFQGLLGGLLGFAKGGVFGPSGVHAFAHGGVVTKPTIFPFANGTGLMGEAGPEAIMPLRRGPDGRLGVAAANSNQPLRIELVSRFDADGGFETAVERSSRPVAQQEAVRATGKLASAVPGMVDARTDERETRRIAPRRFVA